jgi:hypothetical protein
LKRSSFHCLRVGVINQSGLAPFDQTFEEEADSKLASVHPDINTYEEGFSEVRPSKTWRPATTDPSVFYGTP